MPSKLTINPEPEPPPEFKRQILFGRGQAIGLFVLLLIPVLAVLRVLGDSKATLEARVDGLVLNAEVAKCTRYGNPAQLKITVAAPADAQRVEVEVTTDYLERFSDIHAEPASVRMTDRSTVFARELTQDGDAHGGTALVVLDLTPERYGWARGKVRVSTETGGSAELEIKTFIFP